MREKEDRGSLHQKVMRTRELFDGTVWRGPCSILYQDGRITSVESLPEGSPVDADVVLPGLVDCGVTAQGYQEGPVRGNPYAPETAFATLCLAAGVLTVVDTGNDPGPLGHLTSMARGGVGPAIHYAVGRVADRPRRRGDRVWRRDPSGPLGIEVATGAEFLSCGDVDSETLTAVLSAAASDRLTVVLARAAAIGAPGLLFARGGWPSIVGFPDAPLFSREVAPTPDASWFAPQLRSRDLWTVDGLARVQGADRARAFLPYARHFDKPRGLIGRRVARDVLHRLYGDRDPSAVDYPVYDLTLSWAETGCCLAASGSGVAGLVPGDSLWHELVELEALLGTEAALRCATGSTAGLTPAWDAGRIAAGHPADLVVLRGADRSSGVAVLRAAIVAVVVGGRTHDVATLEDQLEDMNSRLQESLL